jgi:hypothetical protein
VLGHVEAIDSAAAVAALELAAAEESAGSSMFDATYIPPADDSPTPAESQFVVTVPTPVQDEGTSSFFDARPSEVYGDAAIEPTIDVHVAIHADLAAVPADDLATGEAAESVDFDTDIAFEAEDAVMFASAVEETPAPAEAASVVDEVAAAPAPEALSVAPAEVPADDVIDPPVPVTATEDRVLLQFAATVPHDLAELQRIAADNQW